MAITVLPNTAKLFVNDKEITLDEDGNTPEMYEVGTKLKIKATAEGHAEKEKDYSIKDELLSNEKNKLDLILAKNKVKIQMTSNISNQYQNN